VVRYNEAVARLVALPATRDALFEMAGGARLGHGARVHSRLRNESVKTPDLENEKVVSTWPANRVRPILDVGGVLWLTTRRLLFVPGRLEQVLRRQVWTCDVSAIHSARVVRGHLRRDLAMQYRVEIRHSLGVERFDLDEGEVATQTIGRAVDEVDHPEG
jgi:hypothetical protein